RGELGSNMGNPWANKKTQNSLHHNGPLYAVTCPVHGMNIKKSMTQKMSVHVPPTMAVREKRGGISAEVFPAICVALRRCAISIMNATPISPNKPEKPKKPCIPGSGTNPK